jgi:hypothetical protein
MKLLNCVAALACTVGAWAQTLPEPKPDIAGITLDSKGKPLRKVDLMLMSLATNAVGEPMPSYSAVSASDGTFEFYGIPPGRYRLLADHAGYLRARFGAKTPSGAGTVLNLRQGVPIAGLEVRLAEQSVISGKVDGPAGGLYLVLLQEKYQDGRRQMAALTSAVAEPSGEFLFNKLAPGSYYLAARPPIPQAGDQCTEEGIGLTTFYPGKPDRSAAEPIVVQRGQSVSANFPVLKSPCFRVSGSVAELPPGSRMTVSLLSAADTLLQFGSSAVVGSDGTFQFSSVQPGAYVLSGYLSGAPAPRPARQTIDVHGDVAGVLLKPEQVPSLQGSLKVEGGNGPVPRLRILLRPMPPAVQGASSAQVGADGSFTFPAVLPARYSYQFMNLPPEAYLKSARLGENDALSGADLTQPDAGAKLELVMSYASAQIEGVILDEQGKPADGTAGLIPDPPEPERAWLYKTAEAVEGGRFQFQGVRPGKYRVYAWEELEPGAHLDPQFTAPYESCSVAIEVGEKDEKNVTIKRIAVDAPPAVCAGGQ